MTHCTEKPLVLQPHGNRRVELGFDGGEITSDAGVLLLRELDGRRGIISRLAACFIDHRDPDRIEHQLEQLVRQRVFALIDALHVSPKSQQSELKMSASNGRNPA